MSKIVERNLPSMVGVTIKAARKRKKMSLARLGSLAGVSSSYLQRIETNQRACISTKILIRILTVLELNVAKLIEIQPSEQETDLGMLVQMGQCSLAGRQLMQEEKDFLITCIEALEAENWEKKQKFMFVLQLFENVNTLKAANI